MMHYIKFSIDLITLNNWNSVIPIRTERTKIKKKLPKTQAAHIIPAYNTSNRTVWWYIIPAYNTSNRTVWWYIIPAYNTSNRIVWWYIIQLYNTSIRIGWWYISSAITKSKNVIIGSGYCNMTTVKWRRINFGNVNIILAFALSFLLATLRTVKSIGNDLFVVYNQESFSFKRLDSLYWYCNPRYHWQHWHLCYLTSTTIAIISQPYIWNSSKV